MGCIAGAVALPRQGAGFQTVHLTHAHFWGAPGTIAAIEQLGQQVHATGLGDVYIEDISRARGGPLEGGHVAHQLGLDVDVGLDTSQKPPLSASERETVELASMVRPDLRGVRADRWNPGVVTLLHLATQLPGIDRILVNPAIKQQLCQEVRGDRAWLRLIRPWYGHAAHMHIHFRCPPGQTDCMPQPPPPQGEGCDATLQWWFDQLNAPPAPAKPHIPTPSPIACKAVMNAP